MSGQVLSVKIIIFKKRIPYPEMDIRLTL